MLPPNPQTPESLLSLLQSNHVTPPTRAVLEARLAKPPVTQPQFFSPRQFATLKAVCARLIPQPGEGAPVDLAGLLDERLHTGDGKGWRYDDMPPEAEAFVAGMDGVREAAVALFDTAFNELNAVQQDCVLVAVQGGTAPGSAWERVPPRRFFEELLVVLVEYYYSHPAAKSLIGDVSFADADGWVRIGLGQQESPLLPLAPLPQ